MISINDLFGEGSSLLNMKQLLKGALRRLGYDLVRYRSHSQRELDSVSGLSGLQKEVIATARPFTMTSVNRMAALVDAVTYVTQNEIPGDIAECGVWRGGSMMAVALTLLAHGDRNRSLFLYDTFEGMSPPTPHDIDLNGVPAAKQLGGDSPGTGIWCYAGIDEVRANILSTGYPEEKIHLIKGKVEDTIPCVLPSGLSLLRLDTDWYESTKHELEHLYPLLHAKGVLIIDDYDHWKGARKAVDEFFQSRGDKIYLHRIDYTGRLLIKSGS